MFNMRSSAILALAFLGVLAVSSESFASTFAEGQKVECGTRETGIISGFVAPKWVVKEARFVEDETRMLITSREVQENEPIITPGKGGGRLNESIEFIVVSPYDCKPSTK